MSSMMLAPRSLRRAPNYERISVAPFKIRKVPNGLENSLIEQIELNDEEFVTQEGDGKPLGRPTVKQQLDKIDVIATSISIASLIAGIVVVANESISWKLGSGTYQLVIIGFLLSIMQLCLTSIAPSIFLILEARYGSSTLQNYEGILRNHMFKSQMSIVWRVVIGLMLILPLGLSVAYKVFLGGYSGMSVDPSKFTGNDSYYGLFAVPGSGNLGRRSGVSGFANATLPFLQAISINGTEPPFPAGVQAYGFNHLVLDKNTAAFLDIPHPDYISKVQQILRPGESWRVTATVSGTVAEYNTSRSLTEVKAACKLIDGFGVTSDYIWAWWYFEALRSFSIIKTINGDSVITQERPFINLGLINIPSPDVGEPMDFSTLWFGFAYGLNPSFKTCTSYLNSTFRFSVGRRQCEGTWVYTRTTVRLERGTCVKEKLPPTKQLMITRSPLVIGRWYMASYCEFFGLFAWDRNTSDWKIPSFVTAVAASVWSRSYALYGADTSDSGDPRVEQLKSQDLGIVYKVKDQVTYIRPTMRKSGFLYLVLAVQPLICVVMLVTKWFLYSTPIDRGFGLTSILSGLDVRNLDSLRGAGLSGELTKEVKIIISPRKATSGDEVDYKISTGSEIVRNGRLRKRTVYY